MRKLIYLLLGVLMCGAAMAKNEIGGHPRILLKSNEEQAIQRLISKDIKMKSIHEHILHCADGILSTQPVVRKKTGKRLLAVSREALKRIYYLSYAYRMTENVKYAERAEKELLSVCDFTDWNPSHYLDVGEMTMAVAIGYDWLYDFLKDDTRKKNPICNC